MYYIYCCQFSKLKSSFINSIINCHYHCKLIHNNNESTVTVGKSNAKSFATFLTCNVAHTPPENTFCLPCHLAVHIGTYCIH